MSETEIQNFIEQTKKDLRTAEEFLAMWRRRNAVSASEEKEHAELPLSAAYGQNAATVRAIISEMPDQYTLDDVEKKLADSGRPMERQVISQTLSRMATNKEIHVAVKGIGRRATTYAKNPA